MDKLNLTELKSLAKSENVKGYSTMTKPALLSHLHNKSMLSGAMEEVEVEGGGVRFQNMSKTQLTNYLKGKVGRTIPNMSKEELLTHVNHSGKNIPKVVRKNKEPNDWVKAVKKYNELNKTSSYIVPKYGSSEHSEVLSLMGIDPALYYAQKDSNKKVTLKQVSNMPEKKTRKPRVKKQ
jgi:hypothetical protein